MRELVVTEPLNNQWLAAHDYDGTIALTSEPAPNGMTVDLAYEAAVEHVFSDHSDAVALYHASGGMNNRAPTEIVSQLLRELGIEQDAAAIQSRSEDLVAAKLGHLKSQVGERLPDGAHWPRFTDGFESYWQYLGQKGSITSAILSSGHEAFIRSTFDIHDLAPPDLFVTDDDMRPLTTLLPRKLTEKPSPLLMQLLHERWIDATQAASDHDPYDSGLFAAAARRTVYMGDSIKKDGELAHNSGVLFVHIRPQESLCGWQEAARALGITAFSGREVTVA